MPQYELLVDEIDGHIYAAIAKNGMLDDLYVDPVDKTGAWASIYQGRVVKVDKSLDVAFVDLGDGLQGFLPAKHIYKKGGTSSERRTGIEQLVKPGDIVLVQIKSEAKRETAHEHHKLPRLTTQVYLFGHHLFYSPISSRVAVSRKVSNKGVIHATTQLKGSGGWLVQSSAQKASESEIEFESQELLREWQSLEMSRKAHADNPCLLRTGPNALFRALGDYGALNFEHIYVSSKHLLDSVVTWSTKYDPQLASSKRLRLHRPDNAQDQLFERYDIYGELEKLNDPRVELADGGSIVIEPTTAMIVIDVNRGPGKSANESNRVAALEIARQTRLRGLSGAILIDFINMHEKQARFKLIETLETAYTDASATMQIHGFTRLGIIEITRKRRCATLAETLRY